MTYLKFIMTLFVVTNSEQTICYFDCPFKCYDIISLCGLQSNDRTLLHNITFRTPDDLSCLVLERAFPLALMIADRSSVLTSDERLIISLLAWSYSLTYLKFKFKKKKRTFIKIGENVKQNFIQTPNYWVTNLQLQRYI